MTDQRPRVLLDDLARAADLADHLGALAALGLDQVQFDTAVATGVLDPGCPAVARSLPLPGTPPVDGAG